MSSALCLADVIRRHVASSPELPVITFLADGDQQELRLTYAELDRLARAAAVRILAHASPGDRVLLLYAPGIEFIAGSIGSLYAGVIAVPTYPPDPGRLQRTLPRLQGIVADARPKLVITSHAILDMVQALAAIAPDLAEIPWIATDDVAAGEEHAWQPTSASGDRVAFLQYTSGSTGTPKGVMLTEANLVDNLGLIRDCFGHGTASRGVIWLPPYHDMGLIGGILQPLFVGFPVTLMSPMHFLRRPVRWLRAISRYRATTSGGPNFAYDLCVRKISEEDRASLDLSTWEVAFVGAEPVQAEVLRRFAEVFASTGFRHRAFYPCYGLAEGTLIASGGELSAPPVTITLAGDALEAHRATRVDEGTPSARTLVGAGRVLRGQEIRIVDPETHRACPAGRVGEVWLRGPSIARGYWAREETTAAKFGASIVDVSGGPYLRTGDLGFFADDELFITGRLDDLIIIRGQNHYPQDIESTVERSDPRLRSGCVAAFTVAHGGEARLVVVAEVEKRHVADRRQQMEPTPNALTQRSGQERRREDALPEGSGPTPLAFAPGEITRAIRDAVSETHQLQLAAIVLVQAGTVPKTTSGKIQRRACRLEYQEARLSVIEAEDWMKEPRADPVAAARSGGDPGD